jgi:DNA-binding beta-propeller fold protein YncE
MRPLSIGVQVGGARKVKGAHLLALFLGLGALILVVGGIAFMVVMKSVPDEPFVQRTIVSTKQPTITPTTPAEPPGFASPRLTFGGEGIGPGLFTDARSIAVDSEGRIYVGEYTGGRIQVFDAEGKFLTQWSVDPKFPLRGMAAARNGTLYIAQRGNILRYEGPSGKLLGELPGGGFDDVAVTADGGQVVFRGHGSDDIVRLSSSGESIKVINRAISSQTDRSELAMRVAVDGLGNIYALGRFNDGVFRFNADGKYVNRFGASGDQPGQFRAPYAIAVDGQGRVYVADFKGVQVFAPDGRYLNVIKVKGAASGMAFNDANELFVVARTHVYKFSVNKQ